MKRSNAPVFWLLFGAGGMLSALLGTALVFVTGIAVPLGWVLPADLLSYPRVLAFAQNWLGKAFLFAVIALFAWHAMHRIFHSLHDVGVRAGTASKLACYGIAMAVTVAAVVHRVRRCERPRIVRDARVCRVRIVRGVARVVGSAITVAAVAATVGGHRCGAGYDTGRAEGGDEREREQDALEHGTLLGRVRASSSTGGDCFARHNRRTWFATGEKLQRACQ